MNLCAVFRIKFKFITFGINLLFMTRVKGMLCDNTFSQVTLRVIRRRCFSFVTRFVMYSYNRICFRQRKLPLAASSGNSRTNLSNSNKRCYLLILATILPEALIQSQFIKIPENTLHYEYP